ADLYGLGEIFDPAQARSALEAIFRHNFKKPIRDYYNPWRVFCVNDEAGLVICDYPEGRRKPRIPLTYAQETMHGFEYAAAILMILRGLVEEGLTVVDAVRERYDGEKRNPWNEIECGSNYARSMASYALLNAFSGFEFNLPAGHIGFRPLRLVDGRFRCFWSLDPAWGEVLFSPEGAEVRVLYGSLSLRSLGLPFVPASVEVAGQPVGFVVRDGALHFGEPVTLDRRRWLRVKPR
ncbi:MAG TPA: GH116 family glycosyl hydrolase, partial [Armatimonadota bacterium]|nr:GH116 family glycosyl hydrolase [Armatimonadota bacterium]